MPFPSVFAAKEAVHFNRSPERSQASVESSGYFRWRVWEIQPCRFHGRHRGSLCAGLQVPKSARPPHPAPARCRLPLGLPAGSRGAGGAGVPPVPSPAHPRRTDGDAAPRTPHLQRAGAASPFQPPRAHTQADASLCVVLRLEGRSAVRYFFISTPKITFSMKSDSYFFRCLRGHR